MKVAKIIPCLPDDKPRTLTRTSTISKERVIALPVRVPHRILLYIYPAIGALEPGNLVQREKNIERFLGHLADSTIFQFHIYSIRHHKNSLKQRVQTTLKKLIHFKSTSVWRQVNDEPLYGYFRPGHQSLESGDSNIIQSPSHFNKKTMTLVGLLCIKSAPLSKEVLSPEGVSQCIAVQT